MKRKIGFFLLLLGFVMILGSVTLYLSNRHEENQADHAAQEKLHRLVMQIEEKQLEQIQNPTQSTPVIVPGTPVEHIDPEVFVMPEMEIDGDGYIGFLSAPELELELPVMAEWDYSKLQISPCRYAGNLMQNNLVIMAHNYARHFGQIDELSPGDQIFFTDVNGKTTEYLVILREVLQPDEIESMTEGTFDLTLFTCTYGGGSRITVRCNRAGET